MRDAVRAVPRRDLVLLGAAMVLGLAIRIAFLVVNRHHPLAGDEVYYDIDAKLWAAGHPFWSTSPSGVPHLSIFKAPGYTAFLGIAYEVLGTQYHRVEALQILVVGPLTIGLVWALARRLFTPGVATAAAFVAAIYPFLWQFELLLYSEALAVPLSAALMLIVIDRKPTAKRAVAAGLLLGAGMLVRPTSVMFGAMIVVAWWASAGWRTGTKWALVSAGCAVLVIVPWTYRNHHISGTWVPISVQDAAAYGTFNDEAANDPEYPYAWRPIPRGYAPIFQHQPPLSDAVLRRTLQRKARDYISEHPGSLVSAWFYNGISRTFDLRRPSHVQNDVGFEGRSRGLTWIGIGMYWLMAPFALLALWQLRRRRGLVWPVAATAAAATLVFTSAAGTRYRATLEPLVIVLACAAVAELLAARRARSETAPR